MQVEPTLDVRAVDKKYWPDGSYRTDTGRRKREKKPASKANDLPDCRETCHRQLLLLCKAARAIPRSIPVNTNRCSGKSAYQ
jgi:hypothetical protein